MPARNGGVLSAPKSSTRTVAVRPASALSSGAIAARWSASARPLRRLEEGELGAQQADALGARGEAGVELGARRGVDEHAHAVAVAGDGGELAVAQRLLALAVTRALRRGRALDAVRSGREHRAAGLAVDDDRLARGGAQHLRAEAHRHRQPEPARDHRGVRGRPAGGEGDRDDVEGELGDVRRPELVGDEHGVDAGRGASRRRPADAGAGAPARGGRVDRAPAHRLRERIARRPSERTSSARAASVGSPSAAIASAWRAQAASSAAGAAWPASTSRSRSALRLGSSAIRTPVRTISASSGRPSASSLAASASSSSPAAASAARARASSPGRRASGIRSRDSTRAWASRARPTARPGAAGSPCRICSGSSRPG